jgi:type I restriction enzyme S subunit
VLSDVLDTIENGNRPSGGIRVETEGIPSLGGEHLDSEGSFKLENIKLIPKGFYEKLKRGKIKKYDVLLVKDGATTGKVSFVDENFPYKMAAVNEHVFILRGKPDRIDQKYLFYHLLSPIGQNQIEKNFHGAAIGGINTQFIKNYTIYLPSLSSQRKIITALERARKLIKLRKYSSKLVDNFLKSTFYEMFGDPVTNPKHWPKRKLLEFGLWRSGGTPSRSDSSNFNGDIPWYSSGELNSLFVIDSHEKINEKAIENSAAKIIQPNSLLLGMYDTAALKSSITKERCACNQAIAYSKLENNNVNIFYLYFAIQFGRNFVMRRQRWVGHKNLIG